MRSMIRQGWALAFLAVPSALATAADAVPRARQTPVISSHQIDRYDAIRSLQEKLQANPKALSDWVILGELAHEVALDSPAEQAARYNAMSLDAYEKALALAPANPGLKAAVQFAKDQQAGQETYESTRDKATQAYLDARRRDLAATNYTPTVRVATPPPLPDRELPQPVPASAADAAPAPAPVPVPTTPNPVVTTTAPVATTTVVPAYVAPYSYQPLYSPATTSPYTYNQFSNAAYPMNYGAPGMQPITAQRYMQQSLMNSAAGQIGRGLLRGR